MGYRRRIYFTAEISDRWQRKESMSSRQILRRRFSYLDLHFVAPKER